MSVDWRGVNLGTRYLGMDLPSPIIAGASPVGREPGNIRQLEDLGAGAVVLPSIFEEQIEHEQQVFEHLTTAGIDACGEALTYFPAQPVAAIDPDRYLEIVRRAVRAVDIPVIASLNGFTSHGWVSYARNLEQAGAKAIELNIYFIPADPVMSGREVEERYIDTLRGVKRAVAIPVAVKLGPYFSSMGHLALQLDGAGADGLVLFNRFYEPDIDLAQLALVPDLELSAPQEMRLPLLWIAILAGRVRGSLAASTGVDGADQVIKYLLGGADVVMTASALLRHGVAHMRTLVDGLADWLAARSLESVAAIRGRMSYRNVVDPTAFERANYIRMLQGYRPR